MPIHGPVTCLLEWCTVSLRPVSCNALLTITDYLETLGTSSFKGGTGILLQGAPYRCFKRGRRHPQAPRTRATSGPKLRW